MGALLITVHRMGATETHFQAAELARVVHEIYEIAGMIDDEMRYASSLL